MSRKIRNYKHLRLQLESEMECNKNARNASFLLNMFVSLMLNTKACEVAATLAANTFARKWIKHFIISC